MENIGSSVLCGDALKFITSSCWSGNSAITVEHVKTADKCRPQDQRIMDGAKESIISGLITSRQSKMSTGLSVKEAILFP